MKIKKNKMLLKRMVFGSGLGLVAGLLCFAGFSSQPNIPAEYAQYQVWNWNNVWLWRTLLNRLVLGSMVAIAGFITVHPLLGFKISVWMRGAKIGFLISLPMAVGSLMNSNPEMAKSGFWMVLIAGTIIGSIIDIVITKFSGEGRELCE
jgi:hypothetical protein